MMVVFWKRVGIGYPWDSNGPTWEPVGLASVGKTVEVDRRDLLQREVEATPAINSFYGSDPVVKRSHGYTHSNHHIQLGSHTSAISTHSRFIN